MAEWDHIGESPEEEANRETAARVVAATARAYARKEADARLKRYRNQAVVGFLILVAGLGYVVHDLHTTSQRARGVVCQIISRGDKQAYVYKAEGLINAKQLHRALVQSAEDRKLLDANCDTGLTPPPKIKGPTGPATPPAPHSTPRDGR
jgi:hypothetical protein